MAEPLEFDVKALLPGPQARIEAGAADSADALLSALALLRELHEHRVLETLTRVTQGGEGLAFHALQILNEPGSVRALRNLLELVKVLGSVDPDTLGHVSGALADGVREGARRMAAGERAGVGELLGVARDPDVGLALGALVGLLRTFARSLHARQAQGDPADVPHT